MKLKLNIGESDLSLTKFPQEGLFQTAQTTTMTSKLIRTKQPEKNVIKPLLVDNVIFITKQRATVYTKGVYYVYICVHILTHTQISNENRELSWCQLFVFTGDYLECIQYDHRFETFPTEKYKPTKTKDKHESHEVSLNNRNLGQSKVTKTLKGFLWSAYFRLARQ